MKTIRPLALQSGDTIGVVAPAGPPRRSALRQGIAALQQLGYRVKLGHHAFDRDGFFAGSHSARISDLNIMIRDRSVRAIYCARGGYGTVYLLSKVDYENLRRQRKILMGASDLTLLLNEVHARTGLITFHGPMVASNFSKPPEAIHLPSLRYALLESGGEPQNNRITLSRRDVLQRGRAQGKLLGGCLSLLVSTLGTPYEIETGGSILFLEDVNEPPYKLDRLLKQMLDAGKFKQVRGLVFGDMLHCIDPKYPKLSARGVIQRVLVDFKGPIVMGLSSGHTRNPFVTLPIGARSTLETHPRPQLIVNQRTTE